MNNKMNHAKMNVTRQLCTHNKRGILPEVSNASLREAKIVAIQALDRLVLRTTFTL